MARSQPRGSGGKKALDKLANGPWLKRPESNKLEGLPGPGDEELVLLGTDPTSWGPAPSTETPPDPFYTAVSSLATLRDLRGYWRLGEGGGGPYADTSAYPGVGGSSPMSVQALTTAMSDIATGALPVADDDGAVQFNESTGLLGNAGDYLAAANHWGGSVNNPFEGDMGTVAGWVKPTADASTFDGGIFSYLADTGTQVGYVLGVQWPGLQVFHQRTATRLVGPALTADEWAFVVGVKDATSTRIYINGALVASGAAVSGNSLTNITPKIGRWLQSNHQTIYGAVDEVSVWGGVLTDAEIALLADAGGVATSPSGSTIAITSTYAATAVDNVILANGTFTVTLPTAVGINGTRITIKNTGVGTITVGRTSSQTIDGVAANGSLTVSMSAREYTSDGTGWQITASYL